MMTTKEAMQKKFVAVSPQSTLKTIWPNIFKQNENAVLVTDAKKKLLGILTREDIMETLYPDYSEYVDALINTDSFSSVHGKLSKVLQIKASAIMKRQVIFTRHDTPVMRALARMLARRVDQLPVLDDKNKVIGMLRKKDIFNLLYKKNRRIFS